MQTTQQHNAIFQNSPDTISEKTSFLLEIDQLNEEMKGIKQENRTLIADVARLKAAMASMGAAAGGSSDMERLQKENVELRRKVRVLEVDREDLEKSQEENPGLKKENGELRVVGGPYEIGKSWSL